METPSGKIGSPLFRYTLASLAVVVLILAILTATGQLNTEFPTLRWCEHDALVPVRGEVDLWLAIEDLKPGLGRVVASIDDGELFEAVALDAAEAPSLRPTPTHRVAVDTRALADGPHKVSVYAFDRSLLHNEGQAFELIVVDNTPPKLTRVEDTPPWAQGRTHALWVRSDEDVTGMQASFLEREVAFYAVGDDGLHRALVGIGVKEGPGPFDVALQAQDLAGNVAELTTRLEIEEVRWPSGGYIALSSTQTEAQKDRGKGADANARRGEAYGHEEPAQLWFGSFQRPAAGLPRDDAPALGIILRRVEPREVGHPD